LSRWGETQSNPDIPVAFRLAAAFACPSRWGKWIYALPCNPERIAITQPRVARNELPWEKVKNYIQLRKELNQKKKRKRGQPIVWFILLEVR
jgi:hypothetical protein